MNLHQQLGPQPSQPRICKWSSLAAPVFPSRHRLQSACNTRLAFDEVGQDMNGLHAVGLLHAMRVDARGSEGACFPPYKRWWCTGNPHTGSAERRCLASRLGRATGQGIHRSSLWLAEQGRLGASTCHPGAARLRVNLGTGAEAAFAWTLRSLAASPALQSYCGELLDSVRNASSEPAVGNANRHTVDTRYSLGFAQPTLLGRRNGNGVWRSHLCHPASCRYATVLSSARRGGCRPRVFVGCVARHGRSTPSCPHWSLRLAYLDRMRKSTASFGVCPNSEPNSIMHSPLGSQCVACQPGRT